MNRIIENIKSSPQLSLAILAIITAFLFKGINYLIIGSSIPFLLGMIIFILIIFSFNQRNRLSRRMFRLWGWLLTFWGTSRLVMELMFEISSITEEHIQSQFTPGQKLLSICVVITGIYIIRKVRYYQNPDTLTPSI